MKRICVAGAASQDLQSIRYGTLGLFGSPFLSFVADRRVGECLIYEGFTV